MIFFNVILASITNGFDKMRESILEKDYNKKIFALFVEKREVIVLMMVKILMSTHLSIINGSILYLYAIFYFKIKRNYPKKNI